MRDASDHLPPLAADAVLIAGPTASGKSALALRLARKLGGAIVNTDSMQVYRELSILSARPSAAEQAQVPHFLYGHVPVAERYSLGRFRKDAANALSQTREAGLLPIFVGGTGMYFGALTDGIADIPAIPDAVRIAAREKLARIGVAALHGELMARDREAAAALRPTDPQRVLRAYEVWEATGKPLAHWQRETTHPVLTGLTLAKYVVDLPRPELRQRIERRFLAMLEAGAAAEARALAGLDPVLPAAKTLGLRELWAYAEGRMTRAQAVEKAVTATRQFAKRQMTWFRHRMTDYRWIPADSYNIITELRQNIS
jgi:tRNA dimethylallyltransferase